MANTYLTKTFSGAGNMDKWTFSAWVKKSDVGAYGTLFHAKTTGNTNFESLCITTAGNFDWEHYEYTSSSYKARLKTNRLLRDPSAFYHIMCVWDSANATAGDRMRLYVNGVEETSFATDTNPTQNQDSIINGANAHNIGGSGTSLYLSGILSHVHFSDGYALAPTVFGETDATTGEWKILTSPSFTLGTNGFTIFKDDNTITDQSTNSNDWTQANGSITATQDCPSNVFCTMNDSEFDYANVDSDIGAGGTFVYPRANTNYNYAMSTLAMPKGNGKFYFEAKIVRYDTVEAAVGIVDAEFSSEMFYENRAIITASNQTYIGRVIVNSNGHSIIAGTANSSYGLGSLADGDIVCMACDMENGAFYFRKNDGSWANSGDPTSGASKTGAIDISATSPWTSSSHWRVWCGDNTTNHDRWAFNFGNGNFPSQSGGFGSQSYSTTAVSSAGTNASGIGIFEFDVPTGYTALCTKGLNE